MSARLLHDPLRAHSSSEVGERIRYFIPDRDAMRHLCLLIKSSTKEESARSEAVVAVSIDERSHYTIETTAGMWMFTISGHAGGAASPDDR